MYTALATRENPQKRYMYNDFFKIVDLQTDEKGRKDKQVFYVLACS